MNFDDLSLDELRKRRGEKWRLYGPEVIPAWVADMDFPVAEPITRFLAEMVARQDLGYPVNPTPAALPTVFAKRALERFGWSVDPNRVLVLTDVVQGLYLALLELTEKGDGAVVQTPIYPPFLSCIAETERRLIENPLVAGPDGYRMDLEALEARADRGTKLFFLCNPHNPTGRAFARAELERLAELALARDWIVVSDEIGADLLYPPTRHIPIATLGPEIAARTITLMSATKGFNIAGLRCAIAVFGSEALKRRFKAIPQHLCGGLGSFGLGATELAWTSGQPWLDEVLAYLEGNRRLVAESIGRMQGLVHYPPQATYLAWIDCRARTLAGGPHAFFLERARVGLSDGKAFGTPGQGFVRLNFATSRAILREILERMSHALAAA